VKYPVNIHIHSRRKRLVDADGVSGKAVIDGFVHAEVLIDDSPKYVEEVSYSQEKCEKGQEEETVIEFWQEVTEVDNELDSLEPSS